MKKEGFYWHDRKNNIHVFCNPKIEDIANFDRRLATQYGVNEGDLLNSNIRVSVRCGEYGDFEVWSTATLGACYSAFLDMYNFSHKETKP